MILRHMRGVNERFVSTFFLTTVISFVLQYLDNLLSITTIVDIQEDARTLSAQDQSQYFDFIIVGAGSAGCILASRLSENPSLRVLLLEAGGEPSPVLNLPTLAFHFNNKKSYDWAHRTVPQRNAALGLNNQVSHWPAGKALGGSTAINGLIYIRGNVQGYDLMASRVGDSIWNTQNIMQFYKKVENYNGWFKKESHGTNGDLSIEIPTHVPVTEHFLRAGAEMGYEIRDPNDELEHKQGFAPVEFYTRNGKRDDVYRASLKKAMERPNLVVRKYSFVSRLLFNRGPGNEVIGVQYERHGKTYTAKAVKETILCAGALGTSKILMLSGIGPKDHLQDLNIPVRVNLPVGQRLQDKYGALVGPFVVPRGYSFSQFRDVNLTSFFNWLATGKGLLSSGRTEATYSIVTDSAKASGNTLAPDIHTYMLSQTPIKPELLFGDSFNFNQKSLNFMEKSTKYGDGFFQLVTMSRPMGFGTVKLQDRNPWSPLIIDPKYLENPRDMKVLVDGIKFAVNLIEDTKAMQRIGGQLFRLPFPGCEAHTFKSDPYYECLGRHATLTAFKYCGTASIGTKDDPEAVVDSRFRVFHTARLRVIDSSLLRVNEVNTNDVTMRMIGELGATVLKLSIDENKNNQIREK